MAEENKKSKLSGWTIGALMMLGLVVLFIVSTVILIIRNTDSTILSLNVDVFVNFMIGMITTLASLAGILLIFENLKKQSKQIEIQQKELKNQIQEMKDTRGVFQRQLFEQTFFSLLKVQNEIRERLETDEHLGESKVYKQNAFDTIRRNIEYNYKDSNGIDKLLQSKAIREYDEKIEINLTTNSFLSVYRENEAYLAQYFRHLYNVLKFIDNNSAILESDGMGERTKSYANFVQAQMSFSELFLLFYNSLVDDFWKMKVLMHKLNFLENLPTKYLLDKSHTNFYNDCEIDGKKLPKIKFKN